MFSIALTHPALYAVEGPVGLLVAAEGGQPDVALAGGPEAER